MLSPEMSTLMNAKEQDEGNDSTSNGGVEASLQR